MPDNAPTADQYWLQIGDVPTGPFTVTQIYAKLASGDATWQTLACPVGGGNWLPLVQTPGIGPQAKASAEPPAPATTSQPSARPQPIPSATKTEPTGLHQPANPGTPTPTTTPSPASPVDGRLAVAMAVGLLIVVIGIVGAIGYGLYEWVRPLSATEVCKKLDEVKTAAEAKKYVTARLYPFVEAMYADKSGLDPNDSFAWTQEIDGPQPNTKLVGFRGTLFIQEAGKRVQIEGHCRVVKSDGWKVDDMVATGVEGTSLPAPVSLVDEYRKSVLQPKATTPKTSFPKTPATGQDERKKSRFEEVFFQIKDSIGWGGIVVLVVVFLVGKSIYEEAQKKPKQP